MGRNLGAKTRGFGKEMIYHETEIAPLVEEVAVDVYAVRLRQILGDEGAQGREVAGFECCVILDVFDVVNVAGYGNNGRGRRD